MAAAVSSAENAGESEDDENEVVEESPDERYQKRKEEVTQRDVPGIEVAYLAMDAEEGVEVVWNEVIFSKRKTYKEQAGKIAKTFNNLILLNHPNIVKFHKWWPDFKHEKARVIFITEYITSGSLKRFLINARKNKKPIKPKQWKKWFRQILSALSYLHSSDPPVIHGNLSCDTVFIQHTGLVKIGCVAPDLINEHVRTFSASKFSHIFLAPEYATKTSITTAVDIYAFGVCALTMICEDDHIPLLEQNRIQAVLDSLQDSDVKNFIQICVDPNPDVRATARQLLFHPFLFEVPSLKQLCCFAISKNRRTISESAVESEMSATFPTDYVIAETHLNEPTKNKKWTYANAECRMQDLEKYLEDFQNGVYPLTVFKSHYARVGGTVRSPGDKSEQNDADDDQTNANPDPYDVENRRIGVIKTKCVTQIDEDKWRVELLIRFSDKMYRELHCDFSDRDTSIILATELVFYGLINARDLNVIARAIEEEWKGVYSPLSDLHKEVAKKEKIKRKEQRSYSFDATASSSSSMNKRPSGGDVGKKPLAVSSSQVSDNKPSTGKISRKKSLSVTTSRLKSITQPEKKIHNRKGGPHRSHVPVVATGFPSVPGCSHVNASQVSTAPAAFINYSHPNSAGVIASPQLNPSFIAGAGSQPVVFTATAPPLLVDQSGRSTSNVTSVSHLGMYMIPSQQQYYILAPVMSLNQIVTTSGTENNQSIASDTEITNTNQPRESSDTHQDQLVEDATITHMSASTENDASSTALNK